MPIFRSRKDIDFVKGITREVVGRVVGETFTYYAISKEFTEENIYGEAKEKVFHQPVKMVGLIEWLEQEISTDQFGQDIVYNIAIYLQREYLQEIEIEPVEGDFIDYDDHKFEILLVETPTQIFAKAGQAIGLKLTCQSVRESTFKPIISGTIDHAARTRPDEPNSAEVDFYNVQFPYSGSQD